MSEHEPTYQTAPPWLTITQASARLNVSPNTLRRMCEQGRVIAVPCGVNGGDWRIHPELVVMPPTAVDIEAAVAKALRTVLLQGVRQ